MKVRCNKSSECPFTVQCNHAGAHECEETCGPHVCTATKLKAWCKPYNHVSRIKNQEDCVCISSTNSKGKV